MPSVSSRLLRFFALYLCVFGGSASALWAQAAAGASAGKVAESTIVRLVIKIENLGRRETVEINGQRIPNYRPKIIQLFPATGILIDERGHVLTFLGYRWVDIRSGNRSIEVITGQGERFPGKMVGIDQSTGVAVIHSEGGVLPKTPLCETCEIRDGVTVVSPVLEEEKPVAFQSAQVVSVREKIDPGVGLWEITMNRRLPGIGDPLLDAEHRVLGYVASHQPSPQDPMGLRMVVYPITQLLESAGKILSTGGDIRTGWLGVYLDDPQDKKEDGIRVRDVLVGSPAQKAGLASNDLIVKWNSTQLSDARQFIHLVQDTAIGTKVNLGVERNGKPLSLAAIVGARAPEEAPGIFTLQFPEEINLQDSQFVGQVLYGKQMIPDPPQMGIVIYPLNPKLARLVQAPVDEGLLVGDVDRGLPGSEAGVQVGDIILSIDNLKILDPQGFVSYIQSRAWGSSITLKLLRRGDERTIIVPLRKPSPAKVKSPKP